MCTLPQGVRLLGTEKLGGAGGASREGNGRLGCVPWEGFAPEPQPWAEPGQSKEVERGPRGWEEGNEQRQIGSDPSLRVWWPVKRGPGWQV